jgi:TonB-linked SusC/RagA family outer membrane protein
MNQKMFHRDCKRSQTKKKFLQRRFLYLNLIICLAGTLIPTYGYSQVTRTTPDNGNSITEKIYNSNTAPAVADKNDMQQRQVRGKVTDSNTGEVLIGATVMVKGTTTGVLTGPDGTYAITIPNESAVLAFSYIGYTPQEIPAANKVTLDVVMVSETKTIDEVVVVGYGTTKKVTLTGSVAAVSSKEMKTVSTTNLATQLAGKLPGLRVTQRTGEPGAFTTVFDVRGMGTPLIVIDGVIGSTDDFVRLNPNDIDGISILKDASAAVYGVKAANGVVLVTTKKGDVGKPKITFTTSYSTSKFINLPSVCNAYEWALLTTENQVNHGKSTITYTAEDLAKFKSGEYPSTNWYDLVARDNTNAQKYNLTVTGGNDRVKYYTSIGSSNEMGIWKSGDLNYKAYTIRSVVTGKISDNLTAELNLQGSTDQRNTPAFTALNVMETTWMHALPITPVYANNNPDYLASTTDGLHPLAMTTASIGGYSRNYRSSLNAIFTLNYNAPFLKGLSGSLQAGYYRLSNFQKNYTIGYRLWSYTPATDTYTNSMSKNLPTTMSENFTPSYRTSIDAQVNYQKTFLEKHNLKVSLVYEDRYDNADNLQASKQFAINIDQLYAGLTNPTVSSSTGTIASNDNQAVIGRLNYDFAGKYLFEAGFNYGGSSKFPAGKRWGFFPYTNLAWRISEEAFFKSAFPYITNFKLRGSWGIMGDDAASSFQFITGYTYPSNSYIINATSVSGLGFRAIPNPNITWFTANTKNIALDASVKNGLLNLSVDFFRRNRTGLLANPVAVIPGTVGASLSQQNMNADMREGFEIVLGQNRKVGQVIYNVSFNVTYTRNRMTKIERIPDNNSLNNWKNNYTNRWDNITWGYNCIGQFQNQDDLNNSPAQDGKGNSTLLPGDYKYEDIDKDGIITGNDQKPIGYGTTPDWNFALNGGVQYKNFDLNFLFQGATHFNKNTNFYNKDCLPWDRNTLKLFLDRWHHADPYDVNSPWIPGKYAPMSTMFSNSNGNTSQVWLEDSKYLRLKSLEIGYNLSPALASRLHIGGLRVYANGFNVLTWSKMKDYDPEINNENSYPFTRDITFGLTLTF